MLPEPQSPPAPLFDAAHLERYTGGDADLTRELLGLMCDQAERCIALMHDASEASAWRMAAHTLKGAARGVGAFALADLCDAVEEQPAAGWSGAVVAVERCFAETRAAFETAQAG